MEINWKNIKKIEKMCWQIKIGCYNKDINKTNSHRYLKEREVQSTRIVNWEVQKSEALKKM